MSDEVDPVEEYLRPGRRRRMFAATAVGVLGLTAAVVGAGWTRLEVPPSAPPPVIAAPAPVVQVPEPPPPPIPKAKPRPRPVPAATAPAAVRGDPPTATVRVKALAD